MATLAKLIVTIGASTAEFEAAIKQTSTHLKNFQRDTKALEPMFNAIGTAIRVVGTAMIGAFVAGGTAALASGQIIEKYRMSLTTLMGSSKAAGEAVASALNLASKTPFSDDQLLAATVALTKFGQDAKTVLPQVADMAAATNGDVEAAAAAFGGFLQGRVKALASYGITKAAVLAEGAKTEQGIQIANQKGTIINEAAYSAALLSLMDKRFKAGAELQANSLAGLIKGMKDTGEDILRTIAGFADDGTVRAGSLFDFIKQGITAVLAKVEEWKANGQLQKWAVDVGQAIMVFFNDAKIVFNWLVDIATWIAKNWNTIIPVIGGVIGAFVAFKTVTTYVDIAAVAVKLFGASIAGSLGPLGLILIATTALAAAITHLIQKQQEENALLNPSLAGLASLEHITALTAAMTEYDAVTERMGLAMTDAGQDATAYYASRVAGHQNYIKEIKEQNDLMAKAALASRNATSKATEAGYAKDIADKKTADDATVALDADLANKIYTLTHTTLQDKLHVIDIQAAKDLAAGKNEVQVATWVKVAKASAYKEVAAASAKLTEAATKKTAEEATKILQLNTDLNDQLYKLSHTTVEGQIYDLDKVRDKAIADGGDKLVADKIYALASKKVYDDAAAAKAKVEKEAADDAAAAWEIANDKQVQDIKDTYDEYISALGVYADKQKDVHSALTQAIKDNYGVQEDAAVTALEVERDKTDDAIDGMISARNRQLDATLAAIDKEKDAALGKYDADIDALQTAHALAQRNETVAGLRTDIATAKLAVQTAETPEDKAKATQDLVRAQKALDKELADEAYQDQLDSLRKKRDLAAEGYADAETDAKAAATSDIDILKQNIKDYDKIFNDPVTGKIAGVKRYYADLMLERNASAEADKLLASQTQDEIMTMLQGRIDEWSALGSQIGDSVFSSAQAAFAALGSLAGTAIPTAPISEGGGGISLKAHAAGGYFTTPHIAVIAERGPEFVVPESQAGAFAARMGGMPVNVTYNINGATDIPAIRVELQRHDKELLGMLRGGRW